MIGASPEDHARAPTAAAAGPGRPRGDRAGEHRRRRPAGRRAAGRSSVGRRGWPVRHRPASRSPGSGSTRRSCRWAPTRTAPSRSPRWTRREQAGWYEPAPSPGETATRSSSGTSTRRSSGRPSSSTSARSPRATPSPCARADGQPATFTVDSVKSYPKTAFPTELVYGPSDRPGLRVVTCGGQFDQAARATRTTSSSSPPWRREPATTTARVRPVGSRRDRPGPRPACLTQAAAEVRTRVRIWRSSTDRAARSARDSSNSPIARRARCDRGGVRLLPLRAPAPAAAGRAGGGRRAPPRSARPARRTGRSAAPSGPASPAVLARQRGDLRQQRRRPRTARRARSRPPATSLDVAARSRGDLDDVEQAEAVHQPGRLLGQRRGGSPRSVSELDVRRERARARCRRSRSARSGQQLGHAGAQPGDLGGDVERRAPVGDQPAHRPVEQPADLEVERGLRRRSATCCPAPRPRRQSARSPKTSRTDHVRPGDLRRAWRRSPPTARKTNVMPPRLTISLTTRGGDDLAAQRVAGHPVGEPLAQRRREVVGAAAGRSHGSSGRSEASSSSLERDLGVGEQHRELRRGQARRRRRAARRARSSVGQELERPVELAAPLQLGGSAARARAASTCAWARALPSSDVLLVVVAQHQLGDLVGHRGQQRRCAASAVRSPSRDRLVEQDLDVDLVVGGVDAGGVVDDVGVDPAAAPGVLDPAELGAARGCRPRRRTWHAQLARRRPGSRRWPCRRPRRWSRSTP